jgi:hypothetical protein
MLKIWFTVLTQYTQRVLTHNSDRLNAISAMSRRLSEILDDECIAGLWKGNLLKCLRWAVKEPSTSSRDTECGAPTWSWASVCRDLSRESKMGGLSFAPPLPLKPFVRIFDLAWTRSGSNRHGNVSGARLTVSGNLLRGYAYYADEGVPDVCKDLVTVTEVVKSCPAKRQSPDLHEVLGDWVLHLCSETAAGRRDSVRLIIRPDTSDGLVEGFVYLLPLAETVGPLDWEQGTVMPEFFGGYVFGLILREVEDGTFERVGSIENTEGYLMTVDDGVIDII